jgi:hypothetical protein
MHSWSTFGARISHMHTQAHNTRHRSNLGEATTFPVATLTLGSRPRQRFARLWNKKEAKNHTTYSQECERVWGNEPSHPQGVSTLGVGVLVDSRIFKKRFQGSNLIGLRLSLYQCKALDEGYNFALDLISIRGLHTKLWHPKVAGDPTLAISRLPLGSLGTKSHLDVGPMGSHRIYYKGEGGSFPQVRVMVSLVSSNCPWFILTPKVLQLCTNHFVWVLCRPVWASKAFQFFLVPSRSSNMPLYPSKVLQTRERASTPCSSVLFCLGLTFESLKELGVIHSPL